MKSACKGMARDLFFSVAGMFLFIHMLEIWNLGQQFLGTVKVFC